MNEQEENLTYEQFINNIIRERGQFGCGREYHERHHIIPKCLGGTNNKSNLIDLFAREHFIAHQLLAKENPHNSGLQFAWWCMASARNNYESERYRCTPEEYEEARKANAEARRINFSGEKNVMYGKHHSPETRKKISEAHKGKPMSEEAKRKISEAFSNGNHPMYGKHPSEETRQKIKDHHADFKGENHPQYGKPKSPETRRKISEARKGQPGLCGKDNPMYGKHPSEDTRRKIGEAERGEKNSQHRPVICIETGERFWGATEAKQKLGVNVTSISMCCRGLRHTAGGFHWRYADEEPNEEQ